jgi:serine/threonine-protein kinase
MESPPARNSILQQLEKMLASESFSGAGRSSTLLRFLVERAVDNGSARLKEYTLGSEALGRGEAFDPRTDPIVRAEASRLRARMERYYASEGRADTLVVTLPKGTYVPRFETRALPVDASATPQVGRHPASSLVQRIAWFALGGITVGAMVALSSRITGREAPAPEPSTLEFDVELTRGDLTLGSDFGSDLALSPDGSRLVFVARGADGQLRLMTRGLGRSSSVELPGTAGARIPFFSPDGRWVAFWAEGKLKKTSVDGGAPIVLAEAVDFGGGSWGEDGVIVAALGRGLARVSSAGGEPTVIADLAMEGVSPRWPEILPGGRHVLFVAIGARGPNAASIEALTLADGTRKPLIPGGTFGRYLRNGHLLYVNQGTLYAAPFDVERLAATGTAVPVVDGISYAPTFGYAQLDVSRAGTLVYRRASARGQKVVSWVDGSGSVEPLLSKPGDYAFPRLSPDSERLALAVVEGGVLGTSVYDRRRNRLTALPSAPGSMSGVFSPDGTFLVIGTAKGMYWAKADEPTKMQRLTGGDAVQVPWSFTADGKRLAYHELGRSTAFDLWTVPVRTSAAGMTAGKPEVFLQTPAYETYPSFSPDGRWIAYGSGAYGPWEVYVRAFPRGDATEVRISEGGGRISRWLPGGRQLLYRTDDHRVMVVDYDVKNGAFVAGPPREWTSLRLADTGVISNFDVLPDGRRIVALLPAARDEDQRIRNHVSVVLHFSDEVRRRVARTGK